MSQTLSGDLEDFLASYDKPPVRGVRANLLKTSPEELKSLLDYKIERSKILEEGFVLNESPDGIGNDPYHIAGLFYIQEPSAMAPIAAAEIKPGMKVLDLCAAPGGKTAVMSEMMGDTGRVYAWDTHAHRVELIRGTMNRLKLENVRPAVKDASVPREEMAMTVEDVLSRRVRLLFVDAREAMAAAPKVAQLMAKELGRDQAWIDGQVKDFTELAKTYIFAGEAEA